MNRLTLMVLLAAGSLVAAATILEEPASAADSVKVFAEDFSDISDWEFSGPKDWVAREFLPSGSANGKRGYPSEASGRLVARRNKCASVCAMTSPSIDLGDAGNAELEFLRFVDDGFGAGSFVKVEVDSGDGFKTVRSFTSGDDRWRHETVDLSEHVGRSIRIRFSTKSDSYREFVMIDDVTVTRSAGQGSDPEPDPAPDPDPGPGDGGDARILFYSSFDTNANGWGKQDGKLPGAITIQSDISRKGGGAVKLFMRRCSWISPKCGPVPNGLSRPRAQLGGGGGIHFKRGTEYWIGYSQFIPTDWKFDNQTHDSFFNLHKENRYNGLGTCHTSLHPKATAPAQPFGIQAKGGNWNLRHTHHITNPTKLGDYKVEKILGPIQRGVWTDFVVNLKLSPGNDGFMKVWINGNLVYERNSNTVCTPPDPSQESKKLPYMNVTVYKANWARTQGIPTRTTYYDELKVAEGSNAYDLVAP